MSSLSARRALVLVCGAAAALAAARAQADVRRLAAIDATNLRVLLLDPVTGAVVNPSFMSGAGVWVLPKSIVQVGQEIWLADQGADTIRGFDLSGTPIFTISGGIANIRGMTYADGYVWLCNAGTFMNAPGEVILKIEPVTGNVVGSFPAQNAMDIAVFNGQFLVSNIIANTIDRYTLAGVKLTSFHSSTGIFDFKFPQQIAVSGSSVYVGGLSQPYGVYRYSSIGALTGSYQVGNSTRGVAVLDSGLILYTDASGIHTLNTTTGATADIATGFATQYVGWLTLPGGPAPCSANCDSSTVAPVLNAGDFSCFLNRFRAAQSLPAAQQVPDYANCDASTIAPVLNAGDFSCFLTKFRAGCP